MLSVTTRPDLSSCSSTSAAAARPHQSRSTGSWWGATGRSRAPAGQPGLGVIGALEESRECLRLPHTTAGCVNTSEEQLDITSDGPVLKGIADRMHIRLRSFGLELSYRTVDEVGRTAHHMFTANTSWEQQLQCTRLKAGIQAAACLALPVVWHQHGGKGPGAGEEAG
ncbi:hypothetical protein HaLaN_08237 [Haematococcus lacustris]|uniref:Uncharacterized protein n=1 Tax=Haematococcus lacustris TaxID=44745 RepID=A0A699YRQ8_HAELA|nr:hypothetical protein HaLaN_08237 [Haematococcus lacustris]